MTKMDLNFNPHISPTSAKPAAEKGFRKAYIHEYVQKAASVAYNGSTKPLELERYFLIGFSDINQADCVTLSVVEGQ